MAEINVIEKEATEKSPTSINGKRGEYFKVKAMITEGLKAGLGEGEGVLDVPMEGQDIETILATVNEGIREFNRIDTVGNGVAAGYAVRNGNTLNLLKSKVKADGENWIDYCAENIVGMSQRTIDKHISIAKIPGVQDHLALGIERLNLLAGAIGAYQSEDPILELFDTHNIKLDPTVEMPFDQFKLHIQRITFQDKLGTQGLELEDETAHNLIEREVEITPADITTAKEIKEAGGDEGKFFQKKLASATKANTTPNANKANTSTPPNKVKSFNKAAVQLWEVIKEATETADEAVLKDIDASMIDELLADLATLKAHLNNQ